MTIIHINDTRRINPYVAWAILAFMVSSSLIYSIMFLEPTPFKASESTVVTSVPRLNLPPVAVVDTPVIPAIPMSQTVRPLEQDQSSIFLAGLSQAHREMLLTNNASRSLEDIVFARQQFIDQVRGSSDAIATEQKISAYLAIAAQSPLFDIISVACGANICEVQGRVYSDAPMEDWSKVIFGIENLPWRADFSSLSSITSEQNGQLVAITYFRRQVIKTVKIEATS